MSVWPVRAAPCEAISKVDLLLDLDVIVDVCMQRLPFCEDGEKAITRCMAGGSRVWVYVGHVPLLERALVEAADRSTADNDLNSAENGKAWARQALESFCADKHWLAALAEEGPVFSAPNLRVEQLIRALDRFERNEIALMTRNANALDAHPEKALTPSEFLQRQVAARPKPFIDLQRQQDGIRSALELGLHGVMHHGRYILGPEVAELEQALAAFTGAEFCISCANGTDALQIALMATGVGPGDEVIVPAFSYIATAEAAAIIGARPVYVDIDPRTFNIDPTMVERAITAKTRAIVPVSLFGQCADFDAINAIAEANDLTVIEDAAQSFGASRNGRRSCSLTTIATTSFFPAKPLGCYGDGGAIFTSDEDLANRARQVARHGQDRRYHHVRVGMNSRLDSIQAAVLLAKLPHLDMELEQRRVVARRYSELLATVRCIKALPMVEHENKSAWAQFTVRVDERESFSTALRDAGIPTAVYYPLSLDQQPAVSRVDAQVPESHRASREVISLPMHPWLDREDQLRLVRALEVLS